MKTCIKCGQEKTLPEFPVRRYKGNKSHRNECKVCTASYLSSYAEKNGVSLAEKRRLYCRENSAKAVKRAMAWKKVNSDKVNYHTARRRAAKINATPAWLTKEQEGDIRAMYALAKKFEKLCNTSYHVDHIVPLAGKDVCGLHVPWNLQLLPASVNIAKSNKHHGQESL